MQQAGDERDLRATVLDGAVRAAVEQRLLRPAETLAESTSSAFLYNLDEYEANLARVRAAFCAARGPPASDRPRTSGTGSIAPPP
eukprot:COSAG01_NODE_24980_length_759_cov_1.871212_2_plen_84_part_01